MRASSWPLVLNLAGVSIAFLYGVGGGSGGETTEGVFMTFWATGWLTVLLAAGVLVWLLLHEKADSRDIALLAVSTAIGFLETRLIISDAMAFKSLFS